MPNHIGIVAYSAEGAALCYRTIFVEGAQLLGPHAHTEVSMNDSISPLPTLDSTRLLARAALRRAMQSSEAEPIGAPHFHPKPFAA